jgi:phosphate-selective porin
MATFQVGATLALAAPAAMGFPVDDTLFLQSADGRNRIELGGLIQVNATAFGRGSHGRDADVFLRRFRLELSGRVDDQWLFNFEPKFTEHEVDLEEAWIGAELERGLLAMAGRMKEPFSVEEARSQKHLAYVNFSILNQFVPAEGHGLTLAGAARDGAWEWGAALYQGGEEGLNDGDEAAVRAVTRPFSGSGSIWRGLQLGAAATVGRSDGDLASVELKNEARVPFATLAPASASDGERVRLGVEAAWWGGPVELTAEAARIVQQVEGSIDSERAALQAWYVGAAWVVTGEERTIKALRPARPVQLRGGEGGGGGALELAGRVSCLHFGDGFVESGVLPAGSDPRRVTSLDVGLNWYLTWNARVKLHGLLTRYAEPIAIGGHATRDEKALLMQLQLHF